MPTSRFTINKLVFAFRIALLAGCVWMTFSETAISIAQETQPVQPAQHTNLEKNDDKAKESRQSASITKLVEGVTQPEQFPSTIKAILMLGVLSLAPAILLMTTCYVRVVVVLSLLRQALGGQNLPPNQVVTALALFVTLLVMAPVWNDIKNEAIDPYTNKEITWETAWEAGTRPVKSFMSRQIEMAENEEDIWVFFQYLPAEEREQKPATYDDIPLRVLLPAFVISELKIAFLIGFQIFLPFLVIDLVVSSVTISMGMFMLPPTMVSLPLKLILFVLVDGWNLVIGMLLQSFAPYS